MDNSQRVLCVEELRKHVLLVYGACAMEHIPPEHFLHRTWEVLNRFVHYQKQNPLIQEAVRRYPDLIPRGYVILTMLYGAYTCSPRSAGILKDFVEMLDQDLVEQELRISEYVQARDEVGFFPGLSSLLQMIRRVYGAEYFDLSVLPPTPHHAYVMFTLNHSDKITSRLSPEELFGILSVDDSKFKKALALGVNLRK